MATENESSYQVDPFEGLKNSVFMGLGLANVPEFRGAPNEDINQFLSEFGRATTTLNATQKCLALKKALVGDAATYLKSYLKEDLQKGEWKKAKAKLRDRFSYIEPALLYRTELNKKSFDPKKNTLLGYVDGYAKLYSKIHTGAKDSELIQDLSLNLGKPIILKLNQISADWKSIEDFESFRKLISRLARDIMALEDEISIQETNDIASKVGSLVSSALSPHLKEFKGLISRLDEKSQDKPETEKLAAVKCGEYPTRTKEYPRSDQNKRRGREWEATDQQVPDKRTNDLMKAYEDRHGRVPGACLYCNGMHWHKHCPLRSPHLKGVGDRR